MQLEYLQRKFSDTAFLYFSISFDTNEKKLNTVTLGIMDSMRQIYRAESALKVGLNNYITLEKSLDFKDSQFQHL